MVPCPSHRVSTGAEAGVVDVRLFVDVVEGIVPVA